MQGASPFVACWGTQSVGELGTATTGAQGLTSPAISTNILNVGAGHDHSCAVDSSHAVWCWGGNVSGQAGGTPGASAPPAVVTGAGTVVEVTTGGSFTCSRNTTGEVYCWGSNAQAQLGGGVPADTATHPTPGKVTLTGAAQVSAGWQHACAVLTGTADGGAAAGPVVCWGNNADGEVGDGTTSTTRSTPTNVVLP
jgi:alpha-tubulin suppressor-like RCC1 family protein